MEQLPKTKILLGDFNSHNPIWNSKKLDTKDKTLEEIINIHNLCLLNQKFSTYLNPSSGTESSIDLSVCDPEICMDYTWKKHSDTCGSDHYPIILENQKLAKEEKVGPVRWKLKIANWEGFKNKCKQLPIQSKDTDNSIEYFTKTLISIASENIPKKQNNYKKN